MNLTVKAVLARWSGDRTAAIRYCYQVADNYPSLRREYLAVVDALTQEEFVKMS